jgi:RNA-binding protein
MIVCHIGNKQMPLKASQKKNLRSHAHHLKPLVTVADKGLSETVIAEIERALFDHELIKVKLRADRIQRKAWAGEIAQRCQAELIQTIGQTACFYKRHPDKPVIDPG